MNLLIAFKGKFNASNILTSELIDDKFESLFITNSFKGIDKDLKKKDLKNYDKIYIFGINKKLRNEIQLEKKAKIDKELNTELDINSLKGKFDEIKIEINKKPTKYLCNYAYYKCLLENKNTLLIHIPGISKINNFKLFKNVIKERIILDE